MLQDEGMKEDYTKNTGKCLNIGIKFITLPNNTYLHEKGVGFIDALPFTGNAIRTRQRHNINRGNGQRRTNLRHCRTVSRVPGGYSALTEWIDDNLKYPVEAAMDGIEGRVIVQFIVRPTGKVVDAEVVRGIAPSLDKEALRLINIMPNWIPGRQKGKAVNVRYTLPITFKL